MRIARTLIRELETISKAEEGLKKIVVSSHRRVFKLVYCHRLESDYLNVYLLSLLNRHFVQIITVKVECNKMLNRELEFSMSITTMVINAGCSAECITTLSIIGSTIIVVSCF